MQICNSGDRNHGASKNGIHGSLSVSLIDQRSVSQQQSLIMLLTG